MIELRTGDIFSFESGKYQAEGDEWTDREESLATCFARHLLMPAEPLQSAVNSRMKDGKVRFEDLFDIAREFDVSTESLLWHIQKDRVQWQTSVNISNPPAVSRQFLQRAIL